MGLSIIFGIVIVLALHGSNVLHFSASTRGVIELAAGALLIAVAAAVLSGRKVQWHPRQRDTPTPTARERRASTTAPWPKLRLNTVAFWGLRG